MKHSTRPPGRRHLRVVTERPAREPLRRCDRMRLLGDQHIAYGIELYQEAELVEDRELAEP
jgi:hypothetical protein